MNAVGSPEVNGSSASKNPQREKRQTKLFSPERPHVASVYINEAEPNTIIEALSSREARQWKAAVESELRSFCQQKVWHPTKTTNGIKALPNRFVFNRKLDSSGAVVRHKARIVVKGYLQSVIEYKYAPAVDFNTIRTALALGVK